MHLNKNKERHRDSRVYVQQNEFCCRPLISATLKKKRPPKLKKGKTPNETFTVLKAKKYIPKNKKLSLGRVDADIKPNGIAFTLKRKDVLSLPNFLKRNKYLKKLR